VETDRDGSTHHAVVINGTIEPVVETITSSLVREERLLGQVGGLRYSAREVCQCLGQLPTIQRLIATYQPASTVTKMSTALNGNASQSCGASPAIWDHAVLPGTRHRWMRPTLTTARQAGTLFTYPGGMEGWVALGVGGYILRWFTCPRSDPL